MNDATAGQRFRTALDEERPLQIVGAINAYTAMMASQTGYRAVYLSGAGVANASYGLPDLGMTSLENVLEDASRITGATDTPLLVDIDTGWGGAFNIARTVREMTRAGVAAVHIEDQVGQKRCGHRPNKELVSQAEMVDRIKAAVDAKTDDAFVVMARTDALAVEGMEPMLERIAAYEAAGADAIFAEAMTEIGNYRRVTDTVSIPVLANLTEFGMTPMYTTDQLASVGIRMALYPLSAFRAMNAAALNVYQTLRAEGTQASVVERKLDELFGAKKS